MDRRDAERVVANKRQQLRLAAMRFGAVANSRAPRSANAKLGDLEKDLERSSDELSSAKDDLRVIELAEARRGDLEP